MGKFLYFDVESATPCDYCKYYEISFGTCKKQGGEREFVGGIDWVWTENDNCKEVPTCMYFKAKDVENIKEMINHPQHYNQGIEAIDYIESHKMNFNIGNVIKYVTRAKHKGTELQDLKKASWYLNREIERLEGEK